MHASGDIASDRDVVRLVGQNEPGRRIAVHQFGDNRWIGGVSTNNAMLTEAKYMAETRDRDSVGLGRKRSLFGPFLIAEDDLIDLIEREAGDLDRRVSEDQFLEFDFKFAKIPLAFSPSRLRARRSVRCSTSAR